MFMLTILMHLNEKTDICVTRVFFQIILKLVKIINIYLIKTLELPVPVLFKQSGQDPNPKCMYSDPWCKKNTGPGDPYQDLVPNHWIKAFSTEG
jgi:hypothetical protein